MITPEDFTRIKLDTYGNPRYVCHFLALIHPDEEFDGIERRYDRALARARKIGGRKFHNKQYGGGIVFQSYNIQEECNRINELVAAVQVR